MNMRRYGSCGERRESILDYGERENRKAGDRKYSKNYGFEASFALSSKCFKKMPLFRSHTPREGMEQGTQSHFSLHG